MTTQLAVRLDDDDLAALDELAERQAVTRSEAARRAIRAQSKNTTAQSNAAELDRVGRLLGRAPGLRWATGNEVLSTAADAAFADDISRLVGDESTDEMTDPWSR
jgi:Ribbon-helix-helix protein, copG family